MTVDDGADVAAPQGRDLGHLTSEEFQELYGPWRPWHPAEVLKRFASAPFPWWVAGGWAAEAGGAEHRDHEDIDLAVLGRDLAAVRHWLADHQLWEAHEGALRPLRSGEPLTPGCVQLWARRNATSPWVADVLLTPVDRDVWVFKRDERVRLPLACVGWVAPDGVSYLRPEVVLLFKAKARRPKDEADFRSLVRHLDEGACSWLRDALAVIHPGHPWLAEVSCLR